MRPRRRPARRRRAGGRRAHRRRHGDARGRRRAPGHRRGAADAADGRARRRADPDLGAGLRPRPRCPTQLIVVGSGVTGAEFASAYNALGIEVVLVSSRDRVLPGEDADAARCSRTCSRAAAWTVLSKSRHGVGEARRRRGHGHAHRRPRRSQGSHCLLALGSIPNTGEPRARGGRRGRSTTAASSGSTGSRGPRPAGCTPPATAPAC